MSEKRMTIHFKYEEHMNNNFAIYNQILEFRKYTRTYLLVNIPKVHSDIRIHFTDESYKLVELLYMAIYTKGNIRYKNITEMLVRISLLDMLLEEIKELKVVKSNYIHTTSAMLKEIQNMTFKWKDNEEKKTN